MCYEAKCRNCEIQGKDKIYHGETARNLYIRSKEHYRALKYEDKNSFMHKHIIKDHGGIAENVEFDWKVLSKHKKPLERQLAEAIQIDRKPRNVNLNSKSEYFKQSTQRIEVVKDSKSEQCEYCGRKFQSLADLEFHEIDVHIKYKCKVCDYEAFGRKDLKLHMNDIHNDYISNMPTSASNVEKPSQV